MLNNFPSILFRNQNRDDILDKKRNKQSKLSGIIFTRRESSRGLAYGLNNTIQKNKSGKQQRHLFCNRITSIF